MKNNTPQRPKPPRKAVAAAHKFRLAVDRLLIAAKQAEDARDKLVRETSEAGVSR